MTNRYLERFINNQRFKNADTIGKIELIETMIFSLIFDYLTRKIELAYFNKQLMNLSNLGLLTRDDVFSYWLTTPNPPC